MADILVRRIHLFYETGTEGAAAATRTAELLGQGAALDALRTSSAKWPRTAR